MSHIPLSADRHEPFTPPALGKFYPAEGDTPAKHVPHPDIEFLFRPPTWEDRDMTALRMYSMGVRDISADQIQAMVVSELFQVFDQDKADEHARFLEGFWTRQQQYQRSMQDWAEQEALRRSDEQIANRPFEPEDPPAETTSPRERADANLLVAEVTDNSQRLRDKLADQQLYGLRYRTAVLRLQLAGWVGLTTEAAWDKRPTLDAQTLSKSTIDGLRGELMEMDPTGAAWDELCTFAEGLFDMPRSTEKNSFLPVASS